MPRTTNRHPVHGSEETRKAASRLMTAKDSLAAAISDHETIGDLVDVISDDLDASDLVEQSKAKLEALERDHDIAEIDTIDGLASEPDQSVAIHHGDKDVALFLDEDLDDDLAIVDLDELDDDEDDF